MERNIVELGEWKDTSTRRLCKDRTRRREGI